MRKIIPSPTAFASFTGSTDYAGNSDADMSRNLAENVDLPAIFRTMDQGVCPGLILTSSAGETVICSGHMAIIINDIIIISFNTTLLDISVWVVLTTIDWGGNATRIPGSEWFLEASTQSLEIRNFSLSL